MANGAGRLAALVLLAAPLLAPAQAPLPVPPAADSAAHPAPSSTPDTTAVADPAADTVPPPAASDGSARGVEAPSRDSADSLPAAAPGDDRKAAASGAPRRAGFPGAPLLLRIPLVDLPHGNRGGNGGLGFSSPSMRQALLWNMASAQLSLQTLDWAWGRAGDGLVREFGLWGSLAAYVYFSTYLPLGEAWLHEEWHRAVLANRGMSSHNGVYGVEIGSGLIAVDRVEDEDLVRLKARHPAEFIRLMSAGIESETESHRLMRRQNFFLGRSSRTDRFLWWVHGLNGTFYLAACANGWIDEDIEEMEAGETAMADRDFTGPEFTAWVHDLRRPDHHYAAGPRGRVHPSGTAGYRRYLATSDLDADERDYLNLQAWLSLLNFASPQSWGPDWLPGALPWSGQRVLWNAGLNHHLTPFGYQVAGDLLLRHGKWNWVYTAQVFVNSSLALPGLSAELFRYPVPAGRKVIYLTGGASLWMQPDGLLFDTSDLLPGAGILAGAALPLAGGLEAWVEADAKTDGWVPGNVNLEPAVQARAGLAWRL